MPCGTALAQISAEQQSAIRGNCRSDFMSKCSGVTPGGKDALMCLQKNVASLSPGCKTAVSATMPAPAPAEAKPAQAAPAPAPAAAAATAAATPPAAPPASPAAPPAADQRTVTSAPPPSAQRPRQAVSPAMPPKQAIVSPPKQAVAAPASIAAPPPAAAAPAVETPPAPTERQLKAIKFTCRRDFSRYCRGVPPGGAQALACLQRSAVSLTPDCKTSLADIEASLPATPAAAIAPPPAATPSSSSPMPVPGAAVIAKACARYILLHCRDVRPGGGREVACLTAYAKAGHFIGPRCTAALKATAPLR